MELDQTKSLAELTGVHWGSPPDNASTSIQSRHVWHRLPLAEVPDAGILRFVRSGIDLEFVIPLAIKRMEDNPELFGILVSVLNADTYPWKEQPLLVNRVRECVDRALSDLGEWDGDEKIRSDANAQSAEICRSWAYFEMRLSKISWV